MRNKSLLKKFYVIFFLVIFMGYYASITFFYHTHIVPGETIGHSHPCKIGADGKPLHSHTEKGYLTIYLLSTITFSIVAFTFVIGAVIYLIFQILTELRQGKINALSYCISLLRAPPQYC